MRKTLIPVLDALAKGDLEAFAKADEADRQACMRAHYDEVKQRTKRRTSLELREQARQDYTGHTEAQLVKKIASTQIKLQKWRKQLRELEAKTAAKADVVARHTEALHCMQLALKELRDGVEEAAGGPTIL